MTNSGDMKNHAVSRDRAQALLEVLVTLFLLSLVLVSFLLLFRSIERIDATARMEEEADALAESELAYVLSLPINQLKDIENQGAIPLPLPFSLANHPPALPAGALFEPQLTVTPDPQAGGLLLCSIDVRWQDLLGHGAVSLTTAVYPQQGSGAGQGHGHGNFGGGGHDHGHGQQQQGTKGTKRQGGRHGQQRRA